MAVEASEHLNINVQGDRLRIGVAGAWTLTVAAGLDQRLRRVAGGAEGDADKQRARNVVIDAGGLTALDSAGAWVIGRTARSFQDAGAEISFEGLRDDFAALLNAAELGEPDVPLRPARVNPFVAVLAHAGEAVVSAALVGRDLLGFFGFTLVTIFGLLTFRRRLRGVAFINQIEATGLNAVPIVGLLCFLVGVVLAYMGALQLERFGAAILTVNLVGVSVLREIGVLLTAIIVAGRSGSAFTAQIGTMKVNQEVDAMETLGLSPIDVLVMPRLLALMVALPLLTFIGDILGLAGGALIAVMNLKMTISQFLTQLSLAVDFWDFGTGMIKAPIFAYVIALVGCHQGLKVSGSAESVGQRTTRSVVESIFIVIVLDAAFAVFFAELGI